MLVAFSTAAVSLPVSLSAVQLSGLEQGLLYCDSSVVSISSADLQASVSNRFVAAEEAGASPKHQEALTSATFDDTVKTLIYTGRPLRVRKTDFIRDWEENKADEAKKMLLSGSIPVSMEDPEHRPFLMGQVAGAIPKVQPAKEVRL